MAARGRQTKQVGFDFGRSGHRVENDRRRVYAKPSVEGRAELPHDRPTSLS